MSIFPEECVDLSPDKIEGDIIEDLYSAEMFVYLFYLEDQIVCSVFVSTLITLSILSAMQNRHPPISLEGSGT